MPYGWWAAAVMAGLWGVSTGAAAGEARAAARAAPKAAPSTSVMPDLVLTGRTRESRAVEARLAAFVRAVRRRDGARAVKFLARETAPSVRTAVERREWPWRTAPEDLGPLFALPGLRLQTVALRPDRARVRIRPQRVDQSSLEAAGFYDIGMVREGRWWQVRLPESASVRR